MISVATAGAAVALLLYSAARNVPHTWDMLTAQHRQFAGLSADERKRYYGTALPLDMGVFDFYRANMRSGDRYWIQMKDEAFGTFADKRTAVTTVAHTYLLPAIDVRRRRDANVILSWDTDPGTLGLRFSSQARAGQQLIFVSRVDRGS
jgi:hypothetical protein